MKLIVFMESMELWDPFLFINKMYPAQELSLFRKALVLLEIFLQKITIFRKFFMVKDFKSLHNLFLYFFYEYLLSQN